MKIHSLLPLTCALILALSGCSLSTQPLGSAAPGKASSSAEMERLIDQPGPVELETINSADWSVPLSGLLNLNRVRPGLHRGECQDATLVGDGIPLPAGCRIRQDNFRVG